MPIEQSKTRLPFVLSKIMLKLSSVFLSRITLFEEYQSSNKIVGHYDHQCQGIEVIVAFFKKRHQALLLKSLIKIRQYDGVLPQPVTDRTNIIGVTKRTYLSSNHAESEIKPNPLIPKPLIQQQEEENCLRQSNISRQSRLQILLSRVKQVNAKNSYNSTFTNYGTRTDRDYRQQNASLLGYAPFTTRRGPESSYHRRQPSEGVHDKNGFNYRQNPSNAIKNSRRVFILQKFRTLQSNLQKLKGGEMTGMSAELMKDIQILKSELRNKKPVHI